MKNKIRLGPEINKIDDEHKAAQIWPCPSLITKIKTSNHPQSNKRQLVLKISALRDNIIPRVIKFHNR